MKENRQEGENGHEVSVRAPSSVTVWSSQERCYRTPLQITGPLPSTEENNPWKTKTKELKETAFLGVPNPNPS